MPHRSICAACRVQLRPPPIGRAALFEYDGVGRAVVLAAKNRHRHDLLLRLGRSLASLVPPDVAEITWVPASRSGRRSRGEDQAEVLARALAAASGRPAVGRLRRGDRSSRRGLDRAARLDGVDLRARPGRSRVAVVDDVVTTGATLDGAVAALEAVGATLVVPLAVAAVAPASGRRIAA